MPLRLRPLLVALSFLSAVALGAIALGAVSALMRAAGDGVHALSLIGGSVCLGGAAAALAVTRTKRPGLSWFAGLVGAFLIALPVAVIGQAPTLVVAGLAFTLGAIAAAIVVGASRSLAGGPDLPGQDLAQTLGVSMLGAAIGVGLPQLGVVASAGFEGLARAAGGLSLLVAVLVLVAVRARVVTVEDEPLAASPFRLMGLGFVVASMLVLGQAVLIAAMGEAPLTRPLTAVALLLLGGVSLALVAARAGLDADLGERRTTAAAGLLFALVALLVPRLPAAFVFTEAVVRPNASAWLVELAFRLVLLLVVLAPVFFVVGNALGCSARQGVRTASNGGRWLSGVLTGAAVGWWLTTSVASFTSLEWCWAAAACGAFAVASWEWRSFVRGVVAVSLTLWLGAGWSHELLTTGPATAWRRAMPEPRDATTFFHLDARNTLTVQGDASRSLVRAGGHTEWLTGKASERVLLGAHAAILTAPGQVRSALVLGVSPGLIEALSAHGVARIDVVAPAPVLDAARHTKVSLEGATVHEAELRAFLESSRAEWDLIVIVPARPGTPLARGLFTLEAWQAARRRLSSAGQLVQQFDLLESNSSLMQTALRTLRVVFPSGTTWGGVGQVSAVVGEFAPVLTPERLDFRMQQAPVAAALKPLALGSSVALLAWQVHSPEGQARMAGPGPTSTDRRPLLELGVPVASFIDEIVELADERRSLEPTSLALSQQARLRPFTAAEFEAMHRALARHFAAWEPLVRSSAEGWLSLAPESDDALAAVVRSALAQNDVSTAVELVVPKLRVDQPAPELVSLAIEAMTAQINRESAVFRLLDPVPLRTLGRETLARHPQHQGLRTALSKLEATP